MRAPETASKDAIAMLSLAALPFVCFPKMALGRATLNMLDLQLIYFPQRKLLGDFFRHGVLPLWNPYAFSGEPLIGNGQLAFLYPPTWLGYFLPAWMALNYYILLQFGIAGAGTYVLARSLRLDRACAFLAATAYMLSGPLTGQQIHLDMMGAAAMLPWVVAGVFRVFQRNTARRFAAATVAVMLQLVAGHPQLPAYTAAALGLCALLLCAWRCRSHLRWESFSPILQLAGIYTLAIGMAAIQLFPWVSMARLSVRAAGTPAEFVFANHMEKKHLLFFLFPYLEGPIRDYLHWEHSYYVGIPTLVLAAGACVILLARAAGKKQKLLSDNLPWIPLAWMGVIAAVGLVFAMGRPQLLRTVLSALPVLGRFRHLGRSMPLVAIALALFAGFGMQFVLGDGRYRWRTLVRVLAVCVAAGPFAFVWFIDSRFGSALLDLQTATGSVPAPGFGSWNTLPTEIIGVAMGALLLWSTWYSVSLWIRYPTILLLVVDMCLFAGAFFPTTTPDYYEQAPPAARFLQQNLGGHRKVTFVSSFPEREFKETVFPQWGFAYGIQDINGFSSLQTRRYADYLQSPSAIDVAYGMIDKLQVLQPNNPLLSSLDVKYVLIPSDFPVRVGAHLRLVFSDQRVQIYENTRPFPRAHFSSVATCEDDPSRVLGRVKADGFDPRQVTYVEGCDSSMVNFGSTGDDDKVSIVHWEPNHITISTSAPGKRFLLLSETYFPGWKATIDGMSTSIFRSNYIFRGLVVPGGKHTVIFRYAPPEVWVGLIVSAISTLAALWLLIRRERTAGTSGTPI
jgi:hypothetical protein